MRHSAYVLCEKFKLLSLEDNSLAEKHDDEPKSQLITIVHHCTKKINSNVYSTFHDKSIFYCASSRKILFK
jgi:hypothetical protein